MKTALTCFALGMILTVTGCTTKVVNTPPGAQNTIIHDRPVVTEDRTPEVQNNIRVDR